MDLRLPEEFARFHLPGSVNLDLVELMGPTGTSLLDGAEGKTVVLASNGMTHPAQAWVALTQAGRSNVRILEDGLTGFRANELTPPSLRGPTTERRARGGEARFAALRARILGTPEVTERYATDPEQLTSPTVVSTRWVATRLGAARWSSSTPAPRRRTTWRGTCRARSGRPSRPCVKCAMASRTSSWDPPRWQGSSAPGGSDRRPRS